MIIKEDRLIAGECQRSLGTPGGRKDPGCAVEVADGHCNRAGAAHGGEQPAHTHDGEEHRGTDQCAERAGGIAVDGESPEEIVTVADMPEGKFGKDNRRQQGDRDRNQPPRGECRRLEVRAAVEESARRIQRDEDHSEQCRLFPIEPLQQRRDDAGGDGEGRDPPGRAQPTLQPAREQEQRDADTAPQEMGDLDESEREEMAQSAESFGVGRGRAGGEQDDPPSKGGCGEERRGETAEDPSGRGDPVGESRAPGRQFPGQ